MFRRLYRPADVDAEDLLNYEDHRMIAPLVGHGPVGGNLTIAGRNLDFARGEPAVSVVMVSAAFR